MDIIKIVSDMAEVRQDIQQLSRDIDYKTRRMDVLIDELLDYMKHKRIVETCTVSSKKPSPHG
jgi:hypothetical protein